MVHVAAIFVSQSVPTQSVNNLSHGTLQVAVKAELDYIKREDGMQGMILLIYVRIHIPV